MLISRDIDAAGNTGVAVFDVVRFEEKSGCIVVDGVLPDIPKTRRRVTHRVTHRVLQIFTPPVSSFTSYPVFLVTFVLNIAMYRFNSSICFSLMHILVTETFRSSPAADGGPRRNRGLQSRWNRRGEAARWRLDTLYLLQGFSVQWMISNAAVVCACHLFRQPKTEHRYCYCVSTWSLPVKEIINHT